MKKIILLLICMIFIVQWLGGFPPFIDIFCSHPYPLVTKFGTSNPISNNALLEDIVFLVLFFFVLLDSSQKNNDKTVIKYIFILNLIGLFFLVYSYFIKGGGNLFGDTRLFFISTLSLSLMIAINNKDKLLKIHRIIFIISIVEAGYIIYSRVIGNEEFLGKNGYANVLLLYFSLMSISVLKDDEDKKSKIFFYSITELIILFLIFIIGYKAMYLAVICFFTLKMKIKKSTVIILFIIPLLVYLISFNSEISDFIASTVESIFDEKGSIYARFYMWNIFIDRILTAPLLGHGFGDSGAGMDIYFSEITGYIGTVHNPFLTIIYYVGVIGFGFIFGTAFLMISYARKSISEAINLYRITFFSLIGFIIYENSMPLLPEFIYYFWIYIGLLLASAKLSVNQKYHECKN